MIYISYDKTDNTICCILNNPIVSVSGNLEIAIINELPKYNPRTQKLKITSTNPFIIGVENK